MKEQDDKVTGVIVRENSKFKVQVMDPQSPWDGEIFPIVSYIKGLTWKIDTLVTFFIRTNDLQAMRVKEMV